MSLLSDILSKREKIKKENVVLSAENEKEMSFLDHLEELRWHILRILAAILVCSIGVFIYRAKVFGWLTAPYYPDFPFNAFICRLNPSQCSDIRPVFSSVETTEQFQQALYMGFFGGLIISFPYIVWEIWRFIKPGLTHNEQKKLRGNVLIISLLFFIGLAFSYYILTPLTVTFLVDFKISPDVLNEFRPASAVDTVTNTLIAGAIMFELPMVVYYLSLLGVLTPSFMREYRRHAFVVLLIIAAAITPGSDLFSLALITIPLVFLYEISIFISGIVNKRREKELV